MTTCTEKQYTRSLTVYVCIVHKNVTRFVVIIKKLKDSEQLQFIRLLKCSLEVMVY